jgi:hypothetical protein
MVAMAAICLMLTYCLLPEYINYILIFKEINRAYAEKAYWMSKYECVEMWLKINCL